jgi:molybdate transport system ATP-binding protein
VTTVAADRLVADLRVADRVRAAFTAEPGEVLAVIGPNGAGKSTLLHALAGLVDAQGHAHLRGTDLLSVPVRERRVGLVFQGQLLFPHLSALDNVAFGPRSRGAKRAAAEAVAREWLERFGIGDLSHRKPRELSGGQAQRVALARALASEPELLLLDEPWSGLDAASARRLSAFLARRLAAGTTLLVAAHGVRDQAELFQAVLALDAGRLESLSSAARAELP